MVAMVPGAVLPAEPNEALLTNEVIPTIGSVTWFGLFTPPTVTTSGCVPCTLLGTFRLMISVPACTLVEAPAYRMSAAGTTVPPIVIEIGLAVGFIAVAPVAVGGLVGPRPVARMVRVSPGLAGVPGVTGGAIVLNSSTFPVPLGPKV